MREKEEFHQTLEEQEAQISSLQESSHKLQDQNQQLQNQVIFSNCSWPNLCSQTSLKNVVLNPQLSEMQVQSLEVQSLKTRLKELEMALTQAEEQVRS